MIDQDNYRLFQDPEDFEVVLQLLKIVHDILQLHQNLLMRHNSLQDYQMLDPV
jgi:hypothetical protein